MIPGFKMREPTSLDLGAYVAFDENGHLRAASDDDETVWILPNSAYIDGRYVRFPADAVFQRIDRITGRFASRDEANISA